jgi:hypothetical protein
MPTVLRIGPFRFHFYANEGSEPPHIHVSSADGECKFWLVVVELAGNQGIRARDLREVEQLVRDNHEQLMRSWHAFQERR